MSPGLLRGCLYAALPAIGLWALLYAISTTIWRAL